MKYVFATLLAVVALMLLAVPAMADPLPGQVLKFQQLPLDGPRYFGHDEYSTAYLDTTGGGTYSGWFMADDFADHSAEPVVHVTWWGSYMGPPGQDNPVQNFLIAFESDIPDLTPENPDTFSHPGIPLLVQTVGRAPAGAVPVPGQFTEGLQTPMPPATAEALYKYNAELRVPFPQKPETVYWLKIVALVDPAKEGGIEWGWHNRDYTVEDKLAVHPPILAPGERNLGPINDDDGTLLDIWHFQDDAVSGQIQIFPDAASGQVFLEQWDFQPQNYAWPHDGPSEIGRFSKDLAFELYAVPEPGTVVMLISAGLIGLVVSVRRWRKS